MWLTILHVELIQVIGFRDINSCRITNAIMNEIYSALKDEIWYA